MAAKDNINNTEWKAWYDNLASKVDDLSTRFSTTDISNPGCAGQDTEGIWQDLRNAQDSSTRLSTDVDLLRKEMAELREKNTMMYKALMSLQRDKTQLREDMRALQQRDDQQKQDGQRNLCCLPDEQFQTKPQRCKKLSTNSRRKSNRFVQKMPSCVSTSVALKPKPKLNQRR